jgi:hypothetical protein
VMVDESVKTYPGRGSRSRSIRISVSSLGRRSSSDSFPSG